MARLASGTMRTPFAWTLRVTISPENSFEPFFLKVPMVAIVSLRSLMFEPAPIAASMACPKTAGAPAAAAIGP